MSRYTTSKTYRIVMIACLVAIEIILSRFLSVSMWNMKIGFAFVPVVIAAMLFGPVAAGITGAVADFLGAILFPIGAYFPGFTLTAFLTGMIYGLFIHKSHAFKNILASILINQIIFSLLLNTLWISILYGSPYKSLLPVRAVQTVILIVVQVIIIKLIIKYIPQLKRSVSH